MKEIVSDSTIQKSYEAVVVGAGCGGLAAAAQLAAKGVQVLLLEQHNLPGGFGSSFVRGRFEFETALHMLVDYGPSYRMGSVRKFFENDIALDIELVEVPDAYRIIIADDGIDAVIPLGVEQFISAIEDAVPGSRPSMTSYIELCKEVMDALEYIGESKGRPDQKVLRAKYPRFLKTTAYSVEEVTRKFNIPDKALKLLYSYWMVVGPPPSRLNFTTFAAFMFRYMTHGSFIPRMRSHEMMTALDERIRELGGDIEYNSRVEKILVQNGEVIGIETAKGDRIETKHVICNASPTITYNNLVYPKEEVPQRAYQTINAREHGLTMFVVYLGLDASAEELGLDTYGYMITPFLEPDRLYENFYRLGSPTVQATVCMNAALPECSPPGTSIVFLASLMRPEAWASVRPGNYFALKNKMAKAMIEQFENKTGIKLSDHIEEIEIATPQTFARYTGTHNGVIYGYEPESWDWTMPRLASIQNEYYIRGLHFSGGFSFLCAGYSNSLLSGKMAANFTIKEMEKER